MLRINILDQKGGQFPLRTWSVS